MLFYNHVPSAIFESASQNPFLHSKPTRRTRRLVSLLDQASTTQWQQRGHIGSFLSCEYPFAFQEVRAARLYSLGHLLLPHHSLVLTGSSSPTEQAAQPPVSWWVIFSSAQRGRKQGGPERSLLGSSFLDNCKLLPGKAEMQDQGFQTEKNSKSSQKEGARKINRRCWEKSKYIDWSNLILLGRLMLAWVILRN